MKAGKKKTFAALLAVFMVLAAATAWAAYHHAGEMDAGKFLVVHPEKAGTKLDHCALCHRGGQYTSGGKTTVLGSCQWCHYTYGYDGAGNIADTMNSYGAAFKAAGRNSAAITDIEGDDSDGDGYTNAAEIAAGRFPGDANDHPGKQIAPFRVYTKAQIMAMTRHKQFLLLNTSRSGDHYDEYTGVVVSDLLADTGIQALTATSITVFSPDGFSLNHPLEPVAQADIYHVNGVYPAASYQYSAEADIALNPANGWCDYSAPSCRGRNHLDPINVTNGLRMILAYMREGMFLDSGILNTENKLDGEGPFRLVPPQKVPSPPDQSSRSANQAVVWPYENSWDHNAGASTRSVTIIRVNPLPAGTSDVDTMEAGWSFVDQDRILIYGAIDSADSNGNGIFDNEEGDNDPDPGRARFRHAKGLERLMVNVSAGRLENITTRDEKEAGVPTLNRPAKNFPFGVIGFNVTGLTPGQTVTALITFPANVPTESKYYKLDATNGWREVAFGSNDGDNVISLTLTDGDPLTDADGIANGTIVDPGALGTSDVVADPAKKGHGSSGSCFISALFSR